jgi:Na+-translocating ferredoxin:NAD+ oxidoreductase subunit B
MDDADRGTLYDRLAEYLDHGMIGTPKSPSLFKILEILFPPAEAEVALNIPMHTTSLSRLREIFADNPNIDAILERMVARGTLFTQQRPGRERVYRLMPSVIGWAETPYWAGRDTPEARKLAPLWVRYRKEAFAEELARGVPVMRVLPVSRTIRDPRDVLPFDAIEPMIEKTTFQAVGMCPCRQIKRYIGEGCDHSLENCLHFDNMGRYMVEQGLARAVTVRETMEIMEASNREGLVHTVNNVQDFFTTICNCCGCCCSFLDTKIQYDVHTISSSNYVAQIDERSCAACGNCVGRCPMKALTLDEAEIVSVDETRCIGCGVCSSTCEHEAVNLVLRGKVLPPPRIAEVIAARYKKRSI